MSMIQVKDLSFTYPGSYAPVFDRVSFQIDTNWNLGLVGRNGRGKTTLLNLLLGKYPYSGTIAASVSFDYFPYPVADETFLTQEVLAGVCPMAEDWELLRELSYLEVEEDVLWRPFCTLSNGERTKVLLAALFLNEGHFLLIDEPTNHLDARARDLVSAYLRKKKGFILVSHDRSFLDGCVDHILSFNRAGVEVQSGNFSSCLENFARRQSFEQTQNQRLQKDIARLQQASRRSALWSDKVEASKTGAADKGYVGHKAAKMMKRSKSLEAHQQQAIAQKSALLQNTETAETLKLCPLTHYVETLASFSRVQISYGGTKIGPPVTFAIQRGERIALEGKNGSGKSSLLKLLVGEPLEHTGLVRRASGLVISYVPQDTGWLQGLLADFAEKQGLEESLFKAILRKMGFDRVQFEKDMADFSAGQKEKVLLARSLCQQAHLYVWDEPLNYIDIASRMQIEQLIRDRAPTMLFVEHDKAFRETVATRVISL